MENYSRVYAKINLNAVEENVQEMRRKLKKGTKMIAVVKTDGYGHGALQIARLVQPWDDIWGFAVATVEEALFLRKNGIHKPILILGFIFPEQYELLAQHEIRPTVFKLSMAKQLSQAGTAAGKTIKIHFAVDTGMSRIGFQDTESSIQTIQEIAKLPGLEIEGLFTHFARADEKDKTSAQLQLERYLKFADRLSDAGISIPMKHCSNSAGLMELPQAHLDAVRPGIILYGIYPSDEMKKEAMKLKPVMELKSHIAYIKTAAAGVPVSYGGTYQTTRPTRIATIPVGYGDGYPRSLSNRGYILVHGKKAPIIGRICMDQFMVDVTDIAAQELDEVTLMGEDSGTFLPVEILSELSGRFPYEFLCDISKRIPRVYIKDQKIIEVSSSHFY